MPAMFDIATNPNKDLILLVLGGAVGLFFNYLPMFLRYVWRMRKKHLIEGEWHSYYYNFDHNIPKLKHERFSVRKGLLSAFAVVVSDAAGTGPSYRGKMEYENGFYLFTLKSDSAGWDEDVFIRFNNPAPSLSPKVIGLGLAKDFQNYASVNVVLLTRDEVSEARVKRLILDGTESALQGRLIRVL